MSTKPLAETPRLTLEIAERIATAALAAGHRTSPDALAVVVLDGGGHLKVAKREDGCPFLIVTVAHAKAYGSVALGRPSGVLAQFGLAVPNLIPALAAMTDGQVMPAHGGVLIRDAAGEILGAIGVSGGAAEHDEKAAIAGVRAAGLVPEPA
jgi:uncharacterized protein GlcG (DUF336 family)